MEGQPRGERWMDRPGVDNASRVILLDVPESAVPGQGVGL